MATKERNTPERRLHPRPRRDLATDLAFTLWRAVARRVVDFHKTLGIVIVSGAAVAIAAAWAFAQVADEVREGATRRFDEAVLQWVGTHRIRVPWLELAMAEVTALGTAVVVMAIVGIAALFLALTRHRYSALLLLVSSLGGIILNNVLKLGFSRPRPQIIPWSVHVMSSSFPSGHAMSAAIAYGTVAWLAARLAPTRLVRAVILVAAALIIVLISASRVYLGVHYPSDVLAGLLVGLAWAAFCMAVLEALVLYGRRRAPQVLESEAPPESEQVHES